ncbi:MAG TPA: TolC family protein [Pyrinomonadaceae bacterium]
MIKMNDDNSKMNGRKKAFGLSSYLSASRMLRALMFLLAVCACVAGQTSPTLVGSNLITRESEANITPSTRNTGDANAVAVTATSPARPSLARAGVTSSETRPLSLNDAIRLALENNNDIEVARNDVRISETALRSLRGVYDPVLVFAPQFSHSISPQSSVLSGSNKAGTLTQTEFSLAPSLVRRFERWGGQYELFFNNYRRSTSSTLNTLNPTYATNFGLTLTQPLWRDREIDRARRDIRIQQKRVAQTDVDFRQTTIELIASVQRAYWDLVLALRDQQNRLANLTLARENLRRIEKQIAAGSTAPLEQTEVQTELSNREADLLLSTQNVSIAENNLKKLLLRDPHAPEWRLAFIPTDQPALATLPVNLSDAQAEARDHRPELRHLQLEEEISEIDRKYFKNQTRPRVDLTSTISTTGLAGAPLTTREGSTIPENLRGGYAQSLSNLVGLGSRTVVVGVTIQLPLNNRTAQADLAGAEFAQQRLRALARRQELQVEVEVRNAVQSVETASQRVLAARSARENAQLQLDGERRLFEVGRATAFLLFQRENQLVNARNQELRAETDYNKALAELQRSTATTLRANSITVEAPTGR